jgi:GLPGLI family protein
MKTLILLPILLASTALYAQQTSGIITYEQTLAFDIKDQNIPEGMAGLLPTEQKNESVLYFSPDASLYEHKEKEKSEQESGYRSENVMIQMDIKVPRDKVYTDLKNKQITEQKDFMDRLFLLNTPIESQKWKFTGMQKKILDMACMEAIAILDKDTVTAWYTTAIPVNAGPQTFSGLPGMILEAHIGADFHLVAIKIESGDDGMLKMIKAPTKGKKITKEDYDKMVSEKTEEMRKQYGGDGNVIIIKHTR